MNFFNNLYNKCHALKTMALNFDPFKSLASPSFGFVLFFSIEEASVFLENKILKNCIIFLTNLFIKS
jgi:hypothetical protein